MCVYWNNIPQMIIGKRRIRPQRAGKTTLWARVLNNGPMGSESARHTLSSRPIRDEEVYHVTCHGVKLEIAACAALTNRRGGGGAWHGSLNKLLKTAPALLRLVQSGKPRDSSTGQVIRDERVMWHVEHVTGYHGYTTWCRRGFRLRKLCIFHNTACLKKTPHDTRIHLIIWTKQQISVNNRAVSKHLLAIIWFRCQVLITHVISFQQIRYTSPRQYPVLAWYNEAKHTNTIMSSVTSGLEAGTASFGLSCTTWVPP